MSRINWAAKFAREKARAADLEDRLDAAVEALGAMRDELLMAGFPGGDRTVALANLRTLIRERNNLRSEKIHYLRTIEAVNAAFEKKAAVEAPGLLALAADALADAVDLVAHMNGLSNPVAEAAQWHRVGIASTAVHLLLEPEKYEDSEARMFLAELVPTPSTDPATKGE